MKSASIFSGFVASCSIIAIAACGPTATGNGGGGGYALAGDIVGIDSGTVFGSAYKTSDSMTQNNNILVKVDVTTGAVTEVGATGFPKLFGVAAAANGVFGFTHDTTGRVITIDTNTGVGTMFGTFMDPSTNKGISFAGAGVSSLVTIQ